MALQREQGDLEIGWTNPLADSNYETADLLDKRYRQYLSRTSDDYILNSDSPDSPLLTSLDGKIQINLSKINSSFDYAEKFKEFLVNPTFKDNDQLLEFVHDAGNDLGRVIYERIQNYLNNYINIDSCHYQALLSAYSSMNIDLTDRLLKNLPVKVEYLINLFSLPKNYYKGTFYDLTITDYDLANQISAIQTEADLSTVNEALNRKYFDNFYDTVVYPIIRNELYLNREDEDFSKFIDRCSDGIYDSLLEGNTSNYIFLDFIQKTLSEKALKNLAGLMMAKFLDSEMTFSVVETITDTDNNVIRADYFERLLEMGFKYTEEDFDAVRVSMAQYIKGTPVNSNINFLMPTYLDAEQMIEKFISPKEEFVDVIKIRLTAKKLTNLCNQICKFRQEIKELRLKDSKVGTAVLIEELIAEFIYKALTKKVGLSNQKYLDSDLKRPVQDLEAAIDITTEDVDLSYSSLSSILEAEQQAIGTKFEKYFEALTTLAKNLEIEVVEYYDTTPSYLNIIPTVESVKRQKYYKVRQVECPPYLNVNGVVVYADFDDQANLFSSKDINQLKVELPQCSYGSEADGYKYYWQGQEVSLDDKKQLYKKSGSSKSYLFQPIGTYKFTLAVNMNKATWDDDHSWFSLDSGTDSQGAPSKKIIDRYDRTISYVKSLILQDSSQSPVIILKNGHQVSPLSNKLIKQTSTDGFIDEYSETVLVKSSDENTYTAVTDDDTTWYVGAFFNPYGNISATKLSNDYVWVSLIKMDKNSVTGAFEVRKIYNNKFIKPYVCLLGETQYQNAFDEPTVKYYDLTESLEFVLDETGDKLQYSNGQIIDAEGTVLNDYASDVELFYNLTNAKYVFKTKTKDLIVALDGNEPFWNSLSYNSIYSDKTVDEELDIIRFYKNLGLIDDPLTGKGKVTHYDGSESMTQEWVDARYNLIKRLKEFWAINAPNVWYDPISDAKRFEAGEIDDDQVKNLKNMDIAYHSNLGVSMEKNDKIKLSNSLINLENWENNTVAIHPCIWNLVEKAYDSYINVLNATTFGQDILEKIFSHPFEWPKEPPADANDYVHSRDQMDKDGMYVVETLTDESGKLSGYNVHTVDYWKRYGKAFFPYVTEYEVSSNSTLNDADTSRFIDFDGPFNYEMLLDVIDHYWTNPAKDESEQLESGSIRNLDVSKYYIDLT